jgi:Protein of unknown function (DUF3575)
MKTNTLILTLLCLVALSNANAQDQCPNFKVGRRKINLTFIPKFKKKEVHIKFTPTIIIGAIPAIKTTRTTISDNDTTSSSSSSAGNTKLEGTYAGYSLQFSLEKKIRKKATLEFSIALESLFRYSYPDTTTIHYPTVNMSQYYNAHGDGSVDSYDEIESQNIRLGLQYRYYFFKKVYKGLYVGPQVLLSYGQNKYHDQDENPKNINFNYKQQNLVVGLSGSMGYQFIIKKHFVIDLTTGIVFKQGINFPKKYANSLANDAELKTKYPNTSALNQKYAPAFSFGIGLGYKFL